MTTWHRQCTGVLSLAKERQTPQFRNEINILNV